MLLLVSLSNDITTEDGGGTDEVSVNVLEVLSSLEVAEPEVPPLTTFSGRFTENKGQRGQGAGLYYALGDPISVAFGTRWMAYLVDGPNAAALVRVEFVGASGDAPVGLEPIEHHNHYFIGNDPDEWKSDVGNYKNVLYRDIWQGVDLSFYFSDGKLKYDLILASGASPEVISFKYIGVSSLAVEGRTGDLVIATDAATFRDESPRAFQDSQEGRTDVACRFQTSSENTLRFDVGSYDEDRPLIIDPGLVFSTRLGGSSMDDIDEVVVDEKGFIYVAGETKSSDFPTTPGAFRENGTTYQDIVIVKMDPDGTSILWSTYLGGNGARWRTYDSATDLWVDGEGDVYVTGSTGSEDFPVTNGSLQTESIAETDEYDAFALKLADDGSSLEFSTLISGNLSDSGVGILVDDEGAVVVAGHTKSPSFINLTRDVSYPPTNDDLYNESDTDVFILKLDAEGRTLLDHVFIGGSMADGIGSFEMDDEGYFRICGITYSPDFPTTSGVYGIEHSGKHDAYVMKIGTELDEVIWSTFLGGSGDEYGSYMDLDPDGSIWIGFMTISSDFPTTPGAINEEPISERDFMLTKVSSDGSELLLSTYLGGNDWDTLFDLMVDDAGYVYMCGFTTSTDLPTTPMALQGEKENWQEGFLYVLDNNVSGVFYCTYIGGESWDGVSKMASFAPLDVVMVGYTSGDGFPTTEDALYPDFISRDDGFVTRLRIDAPSLPGAPVELVAIQGDGHVDLAWEPSNIDWGLSTLGYVVHRGTDPEAMSQLAQLGNVTEYTDDTIENDVSYYYAVNARNSEGEGPMSSVVPVTSYTTPSAPTDLEVTAGVLYIKLTWNPPFDTGGLVLSGFVIYRGEDPGELDVLKSISAATSTYSDDDVEGGVTYHYTVAAINDEGEGALSDTVEATPYRPATVPGVVRLLTGNFEGGKVELSWAAPEDDGGIPLTNYTVLRGTSEENMEVVATLGPVISWIDEDTKRGKTYLYSVAAINDLGRGEPSDAVEVKVPKDREESPDFGIILACIAILSIYSFISRIRE